MSLPAFLLLADTAENRTLCRARALGKRVSVFSPRARAPAGGRSRCEFAKQIRGFSAQSFSPKQMRCYRISAGHAPHQRNPKPAENRTLCRARALGKRVSVFSPRARAPAGGRSRCEFAKQIRGFSAQSFNPMQMRCRSDCSLPCPASTSPKAENPSQNSDSDWDAVSG